MIKKIKSIDTKRASPKKKFVEKLRLQYPRVERRRVDFVPFSPDDVEKLPPLDGKRRFTLSKTLSDEGYHKVGTAYLYRYYGNCLDHVLYRSLCVFKRFWTEGA
jgi:hypothetical protein